MSETEQFLNAVENVLRNMGKLVSRSPAQLVTQWDQLVTWCEEGYYWDIGEYWNELTVRDQLEKLLSVPSLQSFLELAQLREQVSAIDGRFKSLLQTDVHLPNRKEWWERGVLKRAGQAYVDYLMDAYQIPVELI